MTQNQSQAQILTNKEKWVTTREKENPLTDMKEGTNIIQDTPLANTGEQEIGEASHLRIQGKQGESTSYSKQRILAKGKKLIF